jgi:hypothetical protein
MDAALNLMVVAAPFLVGAGMLLYVWWCWSGRYRRWATRVFGDQMVLWLLPGMGVILIAFGVRLLTDGPVSTVLLVVGVAVCFLGFIAVGLEALGFQPRWWGPRWYHDLQASNPQPDLSDGLTALWISRTVPAPFSSDRNAAQAFEGMPVARWGGNYVYDPDEGRRAHGLAAPGAVSGHLTLYRDGLTFAANGIEDSLRDRSTVMAVPAAEVIGARVVPARAGADGVVRKGIIWRSLHPRLVVDTRSGPLLFEVAGAKAKAAKIMQALGRSGP